MQAYSNTDHGVKVSGKVLIIRKPLKTRTWTLPVIWKNLFCHHQGKNGVREHKMQLFSQRACDAYLLKVCLFADV